MALAPASSQTSRLPPERSTLIGRTAQLARLGSLLMTARLVTVTGTGGVGKSRVALRAAADAEADFGDGAVLVELSGLRDPDLLAGTIAGVLELPEADPRPPLEQVLGHLEERWMLLILDTCEHIIDACALFTEALLSRAPNVTVLATSRQPLDVSGEHVFPLAPLAEDDAAELFAQRAADASPGFEVTGATRAHVADLCRHLDGIPLAIELAAAQLRVRRLTEMTDLLGRRPLDAPSAPPSALDRHQTLGDAIAWSYRLCTPEERTLWERLSVFAGPFGPAAAEEVCAGRGLNRDSVMPAIINLVEKSVLTPVTGDGTRYRMLDTLREFGAERLAESGTADTVRGRLVSRYRTRAERLDTEPLHGQLSKYLALRAEHDSIRAALGYAFTIPGQQEAGADLAASLHWYWQISGLLQEGVHWLTRALGFFTAPSPQRARLLLTRGFVAAYGGEGITSLADTAEGLELAEELRDQPAYARGLVCRMRALLSAGRVEESLTVGAQAEKLLPAAGVPGYLPVIDVMTGYVLWATGDFDACLRRCEEALSRLPVDDGERWASSYLLGLSGLSWFGQGDHARGSEAERQALAMKIELDDRVAFAVGMGILALMAYGQRRYHRVTWLLGAGDPLWARYGDALSGTPGLAERITEMEAAARKALGDGPYEELRRAASRQPLDEVVRLAVDDAEYLRPLAPPQTAPSA